MSNVTRKLSFGQFELDGNYDQGLPCFGGFAFYLFFRFCRNACSMKWKTDNILDTIKQMHRLICLRESSIMSITLPKLLTRAASASEDRADLDRFHCRKIA